MYQLLIRWSTVRPPIRAIKAPTVTASCSQIIFVCTLTGISATFTLILTHTRRLLQVKPVTLIMFVQAFTVLLPFVLQAAASPYQAQSVFEKSDDCPTGVHIIGIRGTLEKSGFGALKEVVDQLTVRIPGSDAIAIDYPASGITDEPDGKLHWNFTEYKRSAAEGVAKFSAEVENFTQR